MVLFVHRQALQLQSEYKWQSGGLSISLKSCEWKTIRYSFHVGCY